MSEVPDHRNDLGDWCPRSGEGTADGTCPLYCHEADVITGFDAGDRELPDSTDLPRELWTPYMTSSTAEDEEERVPGRRYRAEDVSPERRRRADESAFRWLKKRNPGWDAERIRLQIARSHVIEENPGLTAEQVDREIRVNPPRPLWRNQCVTQWTTPTVTPTTR
jgi:hypothetical protein